MASSTASRLLHPTVRMWTTTPPSGWGGKSANHPPNQSLDTTPLQNHYKIKPSANAVHQADSKVRPDAFERRLSDMIFSKDVQSDNPVEELRLAIEMAERAKQQQCYEKENSRRRKVVQREEWHVIKTIAREKATCLKELRTTE